MADTRLLIVDGEAANPCELTWDDLRAIAPQFQIPDVRQIDSSRAGRAVTLAGLLDRVQPKPSATHLTLHASADDFHASVPLAAVAERGFFIYAVGDQPLEVTAGGPVRFYIRDFDQCHSSDVDECANVKFVDRVELSAGKGQDNRPEDDATHAELHRRAENE